jgi:hypothetical protein
MDSQIINERIVNETRFQYRRALSNSSPTSTAPSFGVGGYFSDGGGGSSSDHSDHLELQNITTMSAGAHAIKFGTWLRDNRDATTSNGGFNGSFSFQSLAAYVTMLNGLPANQTSIPSAVIAAGGQPNKLSYTTGRESFLGNVFDAAVFFQDDWKFNKFLTLSGGLRWEGQNHAADHSDWAPRFAFAYALDGHKKGTVAKTVVRGGYGFFYDRFQIGSLMGLERNHIGTNTQTVTVINNPTCYTTTNLNTAIQQSGFLASCGGGNAVAAQNQEVSPTYRSPDMEQFGGSLERQLTKVSTLTLTYVHSFGVHQMDTRDANAYLPGDYIFNVGAPPTIKAPRPLTTPSNNLGIVDEMYPEAVFKENQLIANLNARFTPNFSVSGYYNLSFANGDTGTASNSYNLSQDYGRASFVRRNMVFLMGNYTGPWAITFNPFLIAQSGRHFNVTTENDLTGDNFFNDRPSLAASASDCAAATGPSPSQYALTSFGCLDTVPQAGESMLPSELGNGPAAGSTTTMSQPSGTIERSDSRDSGPLGLRSTCAPGQRGSPRPAEAAPLTTSSTRPGSGRRSGVRMAMDLTEKLAQRLGSGSRRSHTSAAAYPSWRGHSSSTGRDATAPTVRVTRTQEWASTTPAARRSSCRSRRFGRRQPPTARRPHHR